MTDTELDTMFADLGGVAPPEALSARTLAAVRSERARSAWRVRLGAAFGMAAMAALSLMVVRAPEGGRPETMVERGSGESAAVVDLRVAVRRPTGELSRFTPGERYAAGDTLMFRLQSTTAVDLKLLRNGAVVWEGRAPAGPFDLPVGYTLEAGEAAAVFSLEGASESIRFPVRAVAP